MRKNVQKCAKMCKMCKNGQKCAKKRKELFKNAQICAKNCVQNRKISTVGQIKPDGVSSVSIFFHLCQTLVQLARAGIPIVLLASTNPRRIILPKSHRTPLTRYPHPSRRPLPHPISPLNPGPPSPCMAPREVSRLEWRLARLDLRSVISSCTWGSAAGAD